MGEKINVGIGPEHFADAMAGGPALTAAAQVMEQLCGVSYVYGGGTDEQTKVTIQQKGHSRVAVGAPITVGIEPEAALAIGLYDLRM